MLGISDGNLGEIFREALQVATFIKTRSNPSSMATQQILVTGGAGFIGSFTVDALIKEGHEVTLFDSIEPQVHSKSIPSYINPNAKLIRGDVTDYNQLKQAIKDKDIIFHLAAMVGVGQSMYQISRYMKVNTMGTANLFDILVNNNHDIKKVITASSMSTYGEGSYECEDCGNVSPKVRTESQMQKKDWELHCPKCKKTVKPIPTKESKAQECTSIYALAKKDQEEITLITGKAFGIPVVALRYFNVYGPRQSLNNPYTGVAAIFMSMIKNSHPPMIFEDGKQSRDFTSVHDITQANLLSMKSSAADYEVFNVGTGRQLTINDVAQTLLKLHKKEELKPVIVNKFRKGDIRHCYADISKIHSKIGFEPKVRFEEGMKELAEWSQTVKAEDRSTAATQELREKGLVK